VWALFFVVYIKNGSYFFSLWLQSIAGHTYVSHLFLSVLFCFVFFLLGSVI
jgi:TRAP-type mannitol/chloroaromatic compound transport system permease large subunit